MVSLGAGAALSVPMGEVNEGSGKPSRAAAERSHPPEAGDGMIRAQAEILLLLRG